MLDLNVDVVTEESTCDALEKKKIAMKKLLEGDDLGTSNSFITVNADEALNNAADKDSNSNMISLDRHVGDLAVEATVVESLVGGIGIVVLLKKRER
ncbi:hypothetical protein LOK49_LG05G03516 [Camellia lanceoleosa]|uniref:Uncharacterized protein n=1 Tax=Camellia lanceoleosa TaxID=1840588 RepID=A0ACC0HLA4_9ERIC|nr:hypothetical protein LOK49_LG05G03516 [Camellia lanceoleosa]